MNKAWLEKMKQKLIDEKAHIQSQIAKLKESDPFADPDHSTDNAAVDTDVREQESHQLIEAELQNLEERSQAIDAALKRIEKDTYGYCIKCNKQIPQARLELIPEAAYCVEDESGARQ